MRPIPPKENIKDIMLRANGIDAIIAQVSDESLWTFLMQKNKIIVDHAWNNIPAISDIMNGGVLYIFTAIGLAGEIIIVWGSTTEKSPMLIIPARIKGSTLYPATVIIWG